MYFYVHLKTYIFHFYNQYNLYNIFLIVSHNFLVFVYDCFFDKSEEAVNINSVSRYAMLHVFITVITAKVRIWLVH
jgi:hypothetical protein